MLVNPTPKPTTLITFLENVKDLTVTLSFGGLNCFMPPTKPTQQDGTLASRSLESSPQPGKKHLQINLILWQLIVCCLVANDHRIDTPALGDTVEV